jgi:hypothetical protein
MAVSTPQVVRRGMTLSSESNPLRCLLPSRLSAFLALVFSLGTLAALGQNAVPTPVYRWTTLAGHPTTGFADGLGEGALFYAPRGIAVDAANNIYVADSSNQVIREISSTGVVSTLAGSPGVAGNADGIGAAARFAYPRDVAVDGAGNVYVADTDNHTLRKITPTGEVTTLAGRAGETGDGTGPLPALRLNHPERVFADRDGNVYFFAGTTLRRINAAGVTDITPNLADPAFYENGQPTTATALVRAVDWNGNFYLTADIGVITTGVNPGQPKFCRLLRLDPTGAYTVLMSSESGSTLPYFPSYVSFVRWGADVAGNTYFVTNLVSSEIVLTVYRIAPDGTIDSPRWRTPGRGGYFDQPLGLAADALGRILHTQISDDAIFRTDGTVLTTLAGTSWSNLGRNGSGAAARFANLMGLVLANDGSLIAGDSQSYYAFDSYTRAVARKVTADGEVSDVYGTSFLHSSFNRPALMGAAANGTLFLATSPFGFPTILEISPTITVQSWPVNIARGLRAIAVRPDGQVLLAEYARILLRSNDSEWTVWAGGDTSDGPVDGVGESARFRSIIDVALTANGDLYVLEDTSSDRQTSRRIRKITPDRTVTTLDGNLAGEGDTWPVRLAVDPVGNFILSYNDHTIRLRTPAGAEQVIGGTSSLEGTANGDATAAQFYIPGALTVAPDRTVYVADNAGVTLRKGEYLGNLPFITTQPQSVAVTAGSSAQFTLTATSATTLSYQWQVNGIAIPGATASSLTLTNVRTVDAGNYTAVVTNTLGSSTSAVATLSVSTPNTGGGGASVGSGSGGGGAPSPLFLALLTVAAGIRRIWQRQRG